MVEVENEDIDMRLLKELGASFVRLDREDAGISGIVVSESFAAMSLKERQKKIDAAFQKAASDEERKKPHMIAGLTQKEYEYAGAATRVHRIEIAGSQVEILVRGCYSDAAYVRDTLIHEKNVDAAAPEESPGVPGMWLIRASRLNSEPLTVALVERILERDENIRIMPNACR